VVSSIQLPKPCAHYFLRIPEDGRGQKTEIPSLRVVKPKFDCMSYISIYCHDIGVLDYRCGMDWILYLLTTCIHHSELHTD
jgi:hypothetical protein